MTDQPTVPEPDPDEPPGWRVLDPVGNVVDSGPMTEAKPAGWLAELVEQARSEGEQ